MNLSEVSQLSFITTTSMMKDKILELHANDWYIESLTPTTDQKVSIVAKKLVAGMKSQCWTDIDIQGFWFRFSQLRDFKVPKESSGVSEK